MKDIKSFTLPQLKEEMEALGEKSFRASQLYEWMHRKLAESYEEMTNIPRKLVDLCREQYRYTTLHLVQVQESRIDGTRKYLFALPDGNLVESVWMRYQHGNCVYFIPGWLPHGLPFLRLDAGWIGTESSPF